jgi:hypothetical protein
VLAWGKCPGSEGVADGPFCSGNTRPAEDSPGAVRNPDVGKGGHIGVMRRRPKCLVVNPRPKTNLRVGLFSVVRGPVEGVDLPTFQSSDDGLLVDGNTGVGQAAVRPFGKTIGQKSGFHLIAFRRSDN